MYLNLWIMIATHALVKIQTTNGFVLLACIKFLL